MCRKDQTVAADTPREDVVSPDTDTTTNIARRQHDRSQKMGSSLLYDRTSYSLSDIPLLWIELMKYVILSAWQGQRLTQLTMLFLTHVLLHWQFLSKGETKAAGWSYFLLQITLYVLILGYSLLVALYRHTIRTVFNCRFPTKFMPSFAVYLTLMKPLEMIFRYVTLRFRVLPDILVLGEVRCGTTSMCQYLASTDGCHEPFCLWRHPELDKKETFFFVGHYLGNVSPQNYRLCFPLAITRFFHRSILRRPFFTFEGCAQYLSSPTAPYLIAKAYKDAGQPPPVLVACVRDPVDQTISWWNYENNAMTWGQSMGLVEWNTCIRAPGYPPENLSSALSYSSSDDVVEMYERAEKLFQHNNIDGVTNLIIPDWAMTWPAGQLSGIGRNGAFATNVQRYERVFREVFGVSTNSPTVPETTKLNFVNVVPLEVTKTKELLLPTLHSLLSQINLRTGSSQKVQLNESQANVGVHRNSTANLGSRAIVPTSADREMLAKVFSDHTKELEAMCQAKFGWQEAT